MIVQLKRFLETEVKTKFLPDIFNKSHEQMDALTATFKTKLEVYNAQSQAKIIEALEFLKKNAQEQNIKLALSAADILISLNMDADALIAVLVCKSADVKVIGSLFGHSAALLAEGVVEIENISVQDRTQASAEHIRKMFFAVAKDIRVIFIRLAYILADLQAHDKSPQKENKLIAQECLNVYAPLADKLGIYWIKAELEDLSLKQLNRQAYQQIKEIVSRKRGERNLFLSQVKEKIQEEANSLNISVEILSRAKHFYSIYQKMKKRNKNAEDIFDLFGIRILCDTQEECYIILSMVHRLWKALDGRFKDYIVNPKVNGYQSLHTTVMTDEGEALEIQIRTKEMHGVAEYGVASHWLYKKGLSADDVSSLDIDITNRLKRWKKNDNFSLFFESIKKEMLKDSIYVFTPQRKVVELPVDSTPIDFAYSIHSAIGDHCIGAKADGKIIPLNYKLKSTQMVEIMTSVNAHPRLSWLQIVKTAKARNKIRLYLQQNDAAVAEKGMTGKKSGVLNPEPVKDIEKELEKEKEKVVEPVQRVFGQSDSQKIFVKVENQRNMMIHFAKCCNPVAGDNIVGYVSRGKGVIVHRKNCKNLKHIQDFSERQIDTQWADNVSGLVKRFKIQTRPCKDIFSEIEGAVSKQNGHLLEGRLEEGIHDKMSGFFTMQLERDEDVKKVLKSIRSIPDVVGVQSL